MDNKIENQVLDILAETGNFIKGEDSTDTHFQELGIDSLDRVEITIELEKHFSLNITDADMESWNTVNDIIKYIESNANSK